MRISLIRISLYGGLIFSFLSCQTPNRNQQQNDNADSTQTMDKQFSRSVAGDYVTADYANRDQGYDWITVQVKQVSTDTIAVTIRSRADKKRPTCSLSISAGQENDSTYVGRNDQGEIAFIFQNHYVRIQGTNAQTEQSLSYYCSGGATIAGNYDKLTQPLDSTQLVGL